MSADQTNTAEAVERVHELKTWPEYFAAVVAGTKPFEIRNNDRGFRRGDKLILREWNPDNGQYTGARHEATVTYVTSFGQIPGHVVLGLSSPELDRLRSRIMELEKALGPFAEVAGEGTDDYPDTEPAVVEIGRSTYYALQLGEFRAAARVLTEGVK